MAHTSGGVDPDRASTYVIAITPFTDEGEFDEDAVRGHLRRMAAAAIGVYVGGGGSGEGYVLSDAEARRLLEISVEELKGRVPVRAMGVEPRTSAQMIEFIEMAAEVGLDAVQIYSLDQGHGHRPTHDEIHRYFDDVLGATTMPAVLSTHQSVGYQVPVPMLTEFADRFDHLIGINCSHQDVGYLTAMIDAVGDRLEIHVGGPQLGLTALSLGANGYLSSEGNLAPTLCVGVIDAYRRDDAQRMTDLYGKLLRLSMAFYGAGGIRATKAVLNALGHPGGAPRLPQLPVSPDRVAQLLGVVDDLNLAQIEGW
ncbi:MAG TPA: dihydrodipicolinate synthase family protein [Acidimicrobiales bacterium]